MLAWLRGLLRKTPHLSGTPAVGWVSEVTLPGTLETAGDVEQRARREEVQRAEVRRHEAQRAFRVYLHFIRESPPYGHDNVAGPESERSRLIERAQATFRRAAREFE